MKWRVAIAGVWCVAMLSTALYFRCTSNKHAHEGTTEKNQPQAPHTSERVRRSLSRSNKETDARHH